MIDGWEGPDACEMSPGAVSTAITVGSVGRGDRRSSFSNLGSCVDMWAPGESIVSAGIEGATSTRQLSGTSQAAPHVAGAAAMLLEQRPRLTPEEVSQQLLSHATLVNVEGVQRSAASDNLLFTGCVRCVVFLRLSFCASGG